MPVQQLKEFLDNHGVRYVSISHSRAYTAQEVAASAHVAGREFAKVVVVKVDGRLALAVCPATERVDLERLGRALGATDLALATEGEFLEFFTGCELGAMPPFGHLYGLETFASRQLARDERIAFNAGTHTEVLQMAYADFARLERPTVIDFGTPA
jgi:Ala-tRNA(Pro) deacylase